MTRESFHPPRSRSAALLRNVVAAAPIQIFARPAVRRCLPHRCRRRHPAERRLCSDSAADQLPSSAPALLRLLLTMRCRAPCRRTARSGVASGPSDRGQVPTLRPAPPSALVGCGRLQGGAGGSGSVDTVQTRRHFGAAQVRAHPPQPDGGPAAGSRHPEAPKFTSRPRCLRAQTG